MNLPKFLQSVLYVLIAVLVVLAFVLGAVRIVLNPWFLGFEYRTPGLPADPSLPQGFSLDERLTYATLAVEYLNNDAGIEFLGDLRFPAGQQTPQPSCSFMDDCSRLFNDRELKHMLDVKVVVQKVLLVWGGALVALAALGLWAWFGKWFNDYRRAVSLGGLFTLIFLGTIIVFVLALFGPLFVFFHTLFFEGNTWLFFPTDTLIRLFPERFWRDTFLIVGALAGAMGLAAWRWARPANGMGKENV